MRERDFQRKLVTALRKQGAVVLVKRGDAGEGAGWPDLYVAHPKWTGWLELKVGTNKPTKRQLYTMRQLAGAGVQVYVLVRLDVSGSSREPYVEIRDPRDLDMLVYAAYSEPSAWLLDVLARVERLSNLQAQDASTI